MPAKKNQLLAPISEVFFSYQGEGIFLSEPQIFVRFSGCNISCNYCDTRVIKNAYYSPKGLLKKIKTLIRTNINNFAGVRPAISFTGGEPLIWKEFLSALLPDFKKINTKIFLETNGTLFKPLKEIIKFIDIVSMDIKPPSACGKDNWYAHRKFLRNCSRKAYVKLVVTNDTEDKEVLRAVKMVGSISNEIPFVFQAVSPIKGVKEPSELNLRRWIGMAKNELKYVYAIPQMHKIWGIK